MTKNLKKSQKFSGLSPPIGNAVLSVTPCLVLIFSEMDEVQIIVSTWIRVRVTVWTSYLGSATKSGPEVYIDLSCIYFSDPDLISTMNVCRTLDAYPSIFRTSSRYDYVGS